MIITMNVFLLKFHFYHHYDTIVLFMIIRLDFLRAMQWIVAVHQVAWIFHLFFAVSHRKTTANLFLSWIYLAIESKYFAQSHWLFRKTDSLIFNVPI